MFHFSKKDHTLTVDTQQEWLETNQSGTYASSTIVGYHRRRYHGLLVTQLPLPYGKHVLLSRFEEYFVDDVQRYPLSLVQYENYFDSAGFAHMQSFDNQLCPCTHYQLDQASLQKETLLIDGKNTLLIKYTLTHGKAGSKLLLRPFLAYRSYHSLAKANPAVDMTATCSEHGIQVHPYFEMPTLKIYSPSTVQFSSLPAWYYNFEYAEEKARGFDYLEDLFTPGLLEMCFDSSEIIIACSTEEVDENDLAAVWQQEIQRRTHTSTALAKKNVAQQLSERLTTRAAEQFLVQADACHYSVEAGYHWFGQWGRDAMISLPGLTLFSGREDICVQVLNHFAAHEQQGLIPNRIAPLAHEHDDYDSIDASLWFFWAVQQYYARAQDLTVVHQHFWPTLKSIIHFYQSGTLYNIQQADNGLIYGGDRHIKLTWMDVIIDGTAITPRNGAAVEINALWYNALCFAAELAAHFKDPLQNELNALIPRVKQSFIDIFWNPALGYCHDFVNEQEINAQCRPNQIIAAALPYSMLSKTMAKSILHTVEKHLLTPYGLRTLSPEDPHYCTTYAGNTLQRDSAYHNGTVWPWLLGPFTDALLQFSSKANARKVLEPCLQALWQHITTQAGIGCISEIFDASAPFHPRGCIQQAWSVAEVIRMVNLLQ